MIQPARKQKDCLRRWGFRAAAVLLGLTVIALAEGVCRWVGWGRPETAVEDPFVGFSDVHPLFVPSDDASVYEIAPSRLKFFAYDSFPVTKPAKSKRVFCLGGSTVQGRPFSIPTSFPTWLELLLNAADDTHTWDVVNCGGVSYASYRLVPILEECLRHQPDYIILCTGHNEFLEERTYGHIKQPSAWQKWVSRPASKLHLMTLLRSALGPRNEQTPSPKPTLADDTNPLLDYRRGTEAYHRDDEFRDGVVAHYEFNVRRMVALARDAGIPIFLVLPPSNLKDCPPFKSETSADLRDESYANLKETVSQARGLLSDDPHAANALFQQAVEIDPRHAGSWYDLGQSFLRLRDVEKARNSFLKARDEDVCPLRIIGPLEAALRTVADETNTPLLDAHTLLEAKTKDGILGDLYLVDHVHPSIESNKRIATELFRLLVKQGASRSREDWETRRDEVWTAHFESLDTLYFRKGRRTLASLRAWTQGRADGPPIEERRRPE